MCVFLAQDYMIVEGEEGQEVCLMPQGILFSRQGVASTGPYMGYPDGMTPVPPLGLGTSPPGTYMGAYGQPHGYPSMPLTPHGAMMHQTPRGYIPLEIQHYSETE